MGGGTYSLTGRPSQLLIWEIPELLGATWTLVHGHVTL